MEPMNTYIASKEELTEIIQHALKELFEQQPPTLLRKANRKPWMNTNELMELTGWSRRTIQYLRDKQRILFSREGRGILYPTEGIEAYLQSNQINPLDS